MNDPLLSGLNPAQLEAVTHLYGPMLVFAGAGSGKTRVLTHRIAWLLRQGAVRGRNIFAVTFTNKAANEMKERIAHLVGDESRYLTVGTFHAACARMLRENGDKIGLPRDFVVYDDGDQLTLVRECLQELHIDDKRFTPRAVLSAISRAKERLLEPDNFRTAHKGFFEDVVAAVYERYARKLLQNRALDFDDLLMQTVRLLEQRSDVLERYHQRYTQIMVDEYQDVNYAQYRLLALLGRAEQNLCVVGDDDQSIYMFRGADVSLILQFEKDYPKARIVKLEQNYRSTQTILDAAYGVVSNNRGRADKRLWTEKSAGDALVYREALDEQDEAYWVVQQIRSLMEDENRARSEFAVLYRTNAQSRVFEDVFLQFRMPYKIVGGMRFYERKEVKDVLAYLRLLHNPSDSVSLKRVINVPARGIGQGTLGALEKWAAERGETLWEAVRQCDNVPGITARARRALTDFAGTIEETRAVRASRPLSEVTEEILRRTGYLAELEEDRSMEAQTRAENVREFITVTVEYDASAEEPSLSGFLEQVALVSDLDQLDSGAEAVTMMTLHSAKGLEFPIVFLVGLEEGIFPHSRSLNSDKELEEERRLCYVGITRARERLYLSHAYRRTQFGSVAANPPSRFLREIPAELFETPPAVASSVVDRPVRHLSPHAASSLTWDRAAAPTPRSTASPEFRAGQKVKHATFGIGVVLSSSPQGEDLQISVAFPNAGVKKLLQSIAKLQKV
jgi:DNA helicase-2/ATP-dependent DNA helicase PcrA